MPPKKEKVKPEDESTTSPSPTPHTPVKMRPKPALKKEKSSQTNKPAPKKAKAAQDDNPAELMVAYLKAQNRPYSAIDISANLHNKVTKVKADKILKELVTEKRIAGNKPDEKARVYWALQVWMDLTEMP